MIRVSNVLTGMLMAALVGCSSDDGSGDDSPSSAGAPQGGAPTAGTSFGGAPSAGAPTGGAPNAGAPNAGASFGGTPGQNETEQVGRIDVTVTAPRDGVAGAVTFIGKFYASPYPVQIAWKTSETVGDCRLLTPVFPFCDPGCGAAVCVSDNQCVSYPAMVNVGTLSVQGLSTQAGGTIMVEPLSESNLTYQPKASAGLMYPGTTPGAPVVVDGSGVYGSFHLEAEGILPFTLKSNEPVRVAPGEPTRIEWTTSDAGDATIEIELEISHHGGVKGQIVCETEDTGSFEIPATLVSKLIDLGVAGFPTVIVTRRSTGSATVPMGRVDLIIASRVDHPVDIPGLVSCSTDADCETGQTCQQDKQCK